MQLEAVSNNGGTLCTQNLNTSNNALCIAFPEWVRYLPFIYLFLFFVRCFFVLFFLSFICAFVSHSCARCKVQQKCGRQAGSIDKIMKTQQCSSLLSRIPNNNNNNNKDVTDNGLKKKKRRKTKRDFYSTSHCSSFYCNCFHFLSQTMAFKW